MWGSRDILLEFWDPPNISFTLYLKLKFFYSYYSVKSFPTAKHLLAPLLPSVVCTPYHLRLRRRNRQLIPNVSKL